MLRTLTAVACATVALSAFTTVTKEVLSGHNGLAYYSTGSSTSTTGSSTNNGGLDGSAEEASITALPNRGDYDSATGLYYFADTMAHTIRALNVATGEVTTIAGQIVSVNGRNGGFFDGVRIDKIYANFGGGI